MTNFEIVFKKQLWETYEQKVFSDHSIIFKFEGISVRIIPYAIMLNLEGLSQNTMNSLDRRSLFYLWVNSWLTDYKLLS